MTNIEFVEGIKKVARDFATDEVIKTLESPAGRRPRKKDLELSKFYNSLPEEGRKYLKEIIKESMDMTLFSIFCVFDHVGFIENSEEKTSFTLYATKNGKENLINDPSKEELHNLYNSLTQNEEG